MYAESELLEAAWRTRTHASQSPSGANERNLDDEYVLLSEAIRSRKG